MDPSLLSFVDLDQLFKRIWIHSTDFSMKKIKIWGIFVKIIKHSGINQKIEKDIGVDCR